MLEHITRLRTRTALREWNRILKEGGTLELRVPNVLGLMKLLTQKSNRSPARQGEWFSASFGARTTAISTRTALPIPYLTALLEEAGFEDGETQRRSVTNGYSTRWPGAAVAHC